MLIIEKRISYIKGALIITLKDLEEGLIDQRSNKRIIILVNKGLIFRSLRQRFKLQDKDKPRVNLKHLAHYILAQIIYIDNQCDIYKAPKAKNKKYLVRISSRRRKVTSFFIILQDSSKYKSSNSRLASILRGLAIYSKALSLQSINSLISLVSLLGRLLLGSRRESLLARLFFFPGIYLILKSYSQI